MFNAVPCSSLKKAREVLLKEKEFILKESRHFSGHSKEEFDECFEVEETKDRFLINDIYDDYWEDYRIERKRVL